MANSNDKPRELNDADVGHIAAAYEAEQTSRRLDEVLSRASGTSRISEPHAAEQTTSIEQIPEEEAQVLLSNALDELQASRARAEVTSADIARLKAETREVLERIEANLKTNVA